MRYRYRLNAGYETMTHCVRARRYENEISESDSQVMSVRSIMSFIMSRQINKGWLQLAIFVNKFISI